MRFNRLDYVIHHRCNGVTLLIAYDQFPVAKAALGEYKVSVTGTPTTGEPTSTEFNVKVVAP